MKWMKRNKSEIKDKIFSFEESFVFEEKLALIILRSLYIICI